jgi:CheY-like chemotaxis protein
MSGKKTVLLVDDDEDFVAQYRLLLENAGYRVRAAGNGQKCLQAVSCDRPDLIILDMMLESETRGFDLSRELRNSEYTKSIPQVMITSVNEMHPFRVEPDRTWLPVDALLEKPLDPPLLLDVVKRMLTR